MLLKNKQNEDVFIVIFKKFIIKRLSPYNKWSMEFNNWRKSTQRLEEASLWQASDRNNKQSNKRRYIIEEILKCIMLQMYFILCRKWNRQNCLGAIKMTKVSMFWTMKELYEVWNV